MRRLVVALTVALLVAGVLPLRAQTPYFTVNLATLNVGDVYAIKVVELDGLPGAEYLLQVGGPFLPHWLVLYPQHAGGLCSAGEITIVNSTDTIADLDGDNIDDIVRFDSATQTVTFLHFPTCQ